MDDLVMEILYKNTLTCPECGSKEEMAMLSVDNTHVYECSSCKDIIQTNQGKCCIYCQYGEVKCPTEQVKWN